MANYGSLRCLILVNLLCGAVISADPLHDAVQVSDLDTVKRLLSSGADVNARTPSGRTFLTMAAPQGHEAIVSTLLAAGADPNAKLNHGETALSLTVQNGHEVIVSALLAAGAHPDARALWVAAQNGHEAIVSALLAAGAGADAGARALRVAMRRL